jgi:transposase
MSQWPSSKHISSWAGVCPGNNESAGKKRSGTTNKGNRWLRRTLANAAWAAARTKDTYFSSAFRRWCSRRGKKKATVALAHAMLVVIYEMLKTRKFFKDLGPDHFDRLDPERQVRYHVKRLEALGQKVSLEPAA